MKVLIVDDSLMMRTLIKDIVSSESYCEVVGLATNGREALDFVKQEDPDLVFLDIEMPVMSGSSFLKRAKLISAAKFVIVTYTALENQLLLKKLEDMGADLVVSKPSGSLSLNLQEEKGTEIIQAIRKFYRSEEYAKS